jgi:hypothetical protein
MTMTRNRSRDAEMTTMRNRKRAARTRDNDGRDRTNEGTPTAWTSTRPRENGQQTRRAITTKGKPHAQDNPSTPHSITVSDCSQGRKQVLRDDQKDGAQAGDDKWQGDCEDGNDHVVQHDGTMGPHP